MIRPAKPKRPPDNAANKGGPRDVPNSRMYSELRELDLRAEQYTNRKKAEICDVNQQLDLQTRTLRLHLYNQHHNQSSSDPQTPPAWSFFIYGQFLDQEQTQRNALAPGFAAEAEKKAATAQKFWTSSMATIQIKIENPTDPSVPIEHFQWQRNRHVGQHKESLEIHRLGKEPCLITVTLTRDFAPELMLVSGRLAKALNLKAGTRGHILRRLWMYAKEHSKVDDKDPANVAADDDLFELFGERRLDMSTLSRKMNAFLSYPEPVKLQHKLVLDGPSPCTALVVDMEVAWSLKPNMLTLPAFLERFDARVLLEEQDRRINECLADFKASHKRYQVLMGFAANPVEYIQKLVAASATEVRDVSGHFYQISSAENFKRAWAQEAAVHMFTKAEGQM